MSLQITHSGIFSQDMIQWDADAADYLARVAIADGQALETSVARAVNDLFIALKDPAFPTPTQPTHWDAVLAGQFLPLCGARTLAGALLPLHTSMPTPTNVNFVPGDYSRKTGIKGNALNKGLDSNFSHASLPRDDRSHSVYITEADSTGSGVRMLDDGNGATTGGSHLRIDGAQNTGRMVGTNLINLPGSSPVGLYGISRESAGQINYLVNGVTGSSTDASRTPGVSNYTYFARGNAGIPNGQVTNARMAIICVARSVILTRLESVFANYLSALNAAIP